MNKLKQSCLSSPARIIIIGFMTLILTGTFLLMLPLSTRSGSGASFLDALFTATSATCVTGLVVHDTYQYWSIFGQSVILLLIQFGGMGVVTVAITLGIFSGKKIGLRQRVIMQESISAPHMSGIVRITGFIVKTCILIELVAAFLLTLRFYPSMGLLKSVWNGIFHSVSAFCNAGFDLMGEKDAYISLCNFSEDPVINFIIMGLIIVGGIGFFVWEDLLRNKWHFHKYRLQTKLVLITTVLLLLLPALYFYFYEFNQPQWGFLTGKERLLGSMFQSVTPRTAGFNTLDLSLLTEPGIMLMTALMLIGGSPGSTAGGFKTTTLASMLLCISAVFQRKEHIQCFGRRIPQEVIRNGAALFSLYTMLFLAGGIVISCIDHLPLMSCLFEAASALGTVGLSLGITRDLSTLSKLILILYMYFGRVGGLTIIYAVAKNGLTTPSRFPQEKITVG